MKTVTNIDIMSKLNDIDNKLSQLLQKNTEIGDCAKNAHDDIPDTEYVTVRRDGVFVGGQPATTYRGQSIYNLDMLQEYFVQIRALVDLEYGKNIVSYNAMSSETEGKFATPGHPSSNDGNNAWIRFQLDDGTYTPWVFRYSYSASNCASYCASSCGSYALGDAALRAGLFGSVGAN